MRFISRAWLLVALALCTAPVAAENLTRLDQAGDHWLWPAFQIHLDRTGQLNADAVAALRQWRGLPRRHEHLGNHPDASLWARFSLRNELPGQRDWMLVHQQSFVDDVQLFRQTQDGAWEPVMGLRDATTGWFGGVRNPSFPLTLETGQEQAFLIRVRTVSLLRVPLLVMPQLDYFQSERLSYMVSGALIAIPLAVSLFIFLLWRIQRRAGLLTVIGLILSEVIGAAWVGGVLHAVVPAMSPRAFGLIGMLSWAATVFLGYRHARLFLFLDRDAPRLARVFRMAPWLVLVGVAMEFAGSAWGRNLLIYFSFISLLAFVSASLWQSWRGVPYARVYALAWGTYFASVSLIVINLLGAIPPNASNLVMFAQGSVVSLLLAFAVAGQLRDTERKVQSELRTLQSARELNRLLAATNHDLRQPLQSLGLFIELTRQRLQTTGSDPEIATWAAQMSVAHASVADTLDSLLALSRLESRAIEVRQEDFALEDLLQTLASEYAVVAASKGLRLSVVSTRHWVTTDRRLLERVLRNLVANAVRYTEQGRVLIGCRGRGDEVSIEVLDSGPGIPKAQQRLVFEEFQQGAAGQDVGVGVGLGLAIVSGLTSLLQIPLALDSVPGRGSRFSIRLPRASPRTAPAPSTVDARLPSYSGAVLVVDDQADVRNALVAGLRSCGANTAAAATLEEAQACLDQGFEPAALVLDYRLGLHATGPDCLVALERRCGRSLPAVFITGEAEAIELLRQQGRRVLRKPVSLSALVRALQQQPMSPPTDAV